MKTMRNKVPTHVLLLQQHTITQLVHPEHLSQRVRIAPLRAEYANLIARYYIPPAYAIFHWYRLEHWVAERDAPSP